MSSMGWIHGEIASELNLHMRVFVKQHKLGAITAAETGFQLTEGTVLAPDIGFVRRERVPETLPAGFVPFAPDLAVEVMSPYNSASTMRDKVELNFRHGTQQIWVVHPQSRRVDIYTHSETGSPELRFLGPEDALEGGDLLPGFRLPLADLFAGIQN